MNISLLCLWHRVLLLFFLLILLILLLLLLLIFLLDRPSNRDPHSFVRVLRRPLRGPDASRPFWIVWPVLQVAREKVPRPEGPAAAVPAAAAAHRGRGLDRWRRGCRRHRGGRPAAEVGPRHGRHRQTGEQIDRRHVTAGPQTGRARHVRPGRKRLVERRTRAALLKPVVVPSYGGPVRRRHNGIYSHENLQAKTQNATG